MSSSTTTHLALLGGIERRGSWTPAPRILHAALVGGADLDLREADLPPETTLVAVSVIGGVHVRVPPGVRVEVSGLRHATHPGAPDATGERVLRIRSFTLLGGVKVEREALRG
jgi:hypothetical protein